MFQYGIIAILVGALVIAGSMFLSATLDKTFAKAGHTIEMARGAR
jgi:Flp pilus assembly pilin Flp